MTELRGKARRYLRGIGNQLRPTVYLGKESISPALLQSLDQAHAHTELVKVRVERSCPLDRKEAGDLLAAAAESHLIQILGNTELHNRPDPDEPQIILPDKKTFAPELIFFLPPRKNPQRTQRIPSIVVVEKRIDFTLGFRLHHLAHLLRPAPGLDASVPDELVPVALLLIPAN